jgi:hypothetical protein
LGDDINVQYLSNGNSTEWIEVDFGVGNSRDIVACGFMSGADITRNIKTGNMQFSDDNSTWTTYWSISNFTSWASKYDFYKFYKSAPGAYTGNPYGAHRYWRGHALWSQDTSFTSCAELAFRATPGGSAISCSGSNATASTSFGGNLPANAFDGNLATQWINNVGYNISWLAMDFTTTVTVSEIAWTTEAASPQRGPQYGYLQFSDDNLSWATTADTAAHILINNQTSWTSNQQRVFTDPMYITPPVSYGFNMPMGGI